MNGPEAVYVITGVMASGQSTVAELFAGSFPKGVYVRGDVFRKMVVSGRAEMTSDEPEEAIRQLRLRYLISSPPPPMLISTTGSRSWFRM